MKYRKFLSFLVALTMIIATFTTFGGYNVDAVDLETEESASYDAVYNDGSVVLNKYANFNELTGKVEITLEAYQTAEYSTSTSLPNIIFVLDISDSMNTLVIDNGEPDVYEPLLGDMTRLDVMQESLLLFLQDLNLHYDQANIAFITFANGRAANYYYETGGVLFSSTDHFDPDDDVFFDITDTDGDYALAQSIVNGLETDPDTSNLSRVDKGFVIAEEILVYLNSQTIVQPTITILYSDGLPSQTSQDGYKPNQVSSAFLQADSIKGLPENSTIYTMILDGIDVSPVPAYLKAYDLDGELVDTYESDEFADGISSDFLEIGNNNYVRQYQDRYAHMIDPTSYDSYSTSISNALDAIIEDAATVEVEYGIDTQIRDYLTDVLEMPDVPLGTDDSPLINTVGTEPDFDGDSVFVYTSDIDTITQTGTDSEGDPIYEYTFSTDRNQLSNDDITLILDGANNGVYVSGYNFSDPDENLCYLDEYDDDGIAYPNGPVAIGKKLIIVVTTDLIPGFIGGNLIATNTDSSGFYSTESGLVNNFDFVTVNVPLEYMVEEVDKWVYITNYACDIEGLANINGSTVTYYQDDGIFRDGTYDIDGLVNKYVDIKYEFFSDTDDGPETSLGTITINDGEITYTKDPDTGIDYLDTVRLLEQKTVRVHITVTPKYSTSLGYAVDETYDSEVSEISSDIYPDIYVKVPTINLQNTTNFLGEVPDYNDFMDVSVSDDGVEWPVPDTNPDVETTIDVEDYVGCGATAATGMPALEITPVYYGTTTEFDGSYATIGTPFAGAVIVEAKLDVDVDITDESMYYNGDLANMDPAEDTDQNKFYLTIVDGEFKVSKTSTLYTSLDEIGSNQGFIFKIEQYAAGNKIADPATYIEGDGDEIEAKTPINTFFIALDDAKELETIKYLSEGYYKVTVMENWSDKYNSDPIATEYFFVGRDGTGDDATFWYVNNWYDENGTDLVDDMIGLVGTTNDVFTFNFTTKTLTEYPWIGDVAVSRNTVDISLDPQ